MSQPDASLPKFFEIESVWQGTTGGLSYDCESQTMRVRGEYLPREPRRPWYVAEGEGLAIPSSDNLRGKLRRNRAHPKAVVTPTQQEWGLLFTIAERVCIWGIRGTEDFFNICDGAGCRVEIEFADRILQTAISRGEHVAQWGLFDAACRVFVGESRLGILSRKVEPIWNHDYVDMAYSKFIPEAEDPSTAEILMELLDLWEKAVTPKGRSLPLTISDWESAASYWETQSDSKRQQLCKEVLASLAENNNVRALPDQIRPWWTVVSRFDGPPCHVCGRQLRTEKSEQCFSCGADWHGNDPYKRNVPILNGGWAVWIFLSLLMCAFIVMAIAFAKRPFNTTQYAFCAFFACAAAACIVKGLLFCASRLEFSRANLKIQFAFRLLCIDWSMVKSARFEENRGKSKFLGSIFGGEIPVPVGGVIPNISYYELVLSLENRKEICLPVSPEFKEAISKTIKELASLDPAFELTRRARLRENNNVESKTFGYLQGAIFGIGGLGIVCASLANAIKLNAWNASLDGFALGAFVVVLGVFFVFKELRMVHWLRRGRMRKNSNCSDTDAEVSDKELSWAERVRGSKK